jgi:hypothetical protein
MLAPASVAAAAAGAAPAAGGGDAPAAGGPGTEAIVAAGRVAAIVAALNAVPGADGCRGIVVMENKVQTPYGGSTFRS